MQATTACDRCHSIKSRCTYTASQDACDRCTRLSHKCETLRVIGKAGRPQSRRAQASSSSPSQKSPKKEHASPSVSAGDGGPPDPLAEFESSEVHLAQYLVRDQRLDQRFVNSFAIESFFSNTMESTMIRQLLAAPDQVKDALLALSGALRAEDQGPSSPGSAAEMKANIQRCCAALEKMRLSDSATEDDARALLFVATSLVSFNDLTFGYGYLPVASAAVLAIQPWLPSVMHDPSPQFDPNLIPLIFAELSECQRCAEAPTFRWVVPRNQLIDRSYGIAHEVLPHLYDICMLTHALAGRHVSNDQLIQRAAEIGANLDQWTPEIQNYTTRDSQLHLSDYQKAQITVHAECYKLLAQLLLQQLQSHVADTRLFRGHIANQIRQEIARFNSGGTRQVLYLLYPYFVACVELDDPLEQDLVLAQMKDLSGGIATQSCNTMFAFLQFAWASAAVDPNMSWIELVSMGPNFSIGP